MKLDSTQEEMHRRRRYSTKHIRRRGLAQPGDKLKVSGHWMEMNWD